MRLYDLLLTAHTLAAMAWIGSGFLLLLLTNRAARRPDGEALGRIIDDTAFLGARLFMPAALLTFAMGLALTIDGPWSLGHLWIVLGLAGFFTTFITGALVLKPRGDRIAELRRRDGRMSPEANFVARRMLALGRTDYVVLCLVVADMAIKPTGDDTAVLAAMAAVLVAGLSFVIAGYRAIEAPAVASGPARSFGRSQTASELPNRDAG
jgi:hypothetical protein